MSKFKILISSVPDREKLVAEIWYNESFVAEINQETEILEIEFNNIKGIKLNLEYLLEAINIAKDKLR